jgi:predicted Rossmann fold nucleotide-binding protein DprA/Smf involved in DNA uptake
VNSELSPNTQAILLLTAPLSVGQHEQPERPLGLKEYNLLAARLRELRYQPGDLLTAKAEQLLQECQAVVDSARMRQLLERGFLLSQAVEHWGARAIWVMSRADGTYPPRLRQRLKDLAPPVLYGCGDASILSTGGLAVVGSRHVDERLLEYTAAVGRLAARARKTVVSGGAKGVDDAAMQGALSEGGQVVGILADSLEKAALSRRNREHLLGRNLVLVTPYDPGAPFNVGHAMRRNALIYALSDAALVVNADLEKGGTWAGATEQLERFRFVPVFVRSSGELGEGLRALAKKGARPWPEPPDAEALTMTMSELPPDRLARQSELPLVPAAEVPSSMAAELFRKFRDLVVQILRSPMDEKDISSTLQLTEAQTREWLERLITEGIVRRSSMSRYEIADERLAVS